MKKITLLVVAVLSIISLAACGNEKVENKPDNGEVPNISSVNENGDSKTLKILAKDNYYITYRAEIEGQEMEMELSKKGEKIATRAVTEEGSVRMVQDGNDIYVMMDDAKTMMKSTVNDTEDLSSKDILKDDEIYTVGEEEIDGVNYYYEDFSTSRFYFLGDDLKLIKENDEVIEVVKYESNSKDEMFEIPTDYTDLLSGISDMIEMPEEYQDLANTPNE